MFDLLLTLCLTAAPGVCVERRVFAPEPLDRGACQSDAETRAAAWTEAHDGLRLKGWTCAKSEAGLTVSEIAPGILVHRGPIVVPDTTTGGDLANMAAVVGDDSVAVIDASGSRATGEAWLAAIRRATGKPVRWLILTHMHPDHVLGAEPFVEAGAEVIGHAKLARALAARADTYTDNFRRLLGEAGFAGTVVIEPDQAVETTLELDLGGRTLVLEAHPTAHTDNDLTVLDSATGTLIAGDLVFIEHVPALDGSITGWIGVLDDLVARGNIRRVVPGHGPVAGWPAGAAPTRDYLEALAVETRAVIDAGEPMSEATRHLGEGLRGDWQVFDEFNARNATAAYKELEWE